MISIKREGEFIIKTSDITATSLRTLQRLFSYYNPKTEEMRTSITVTKGFVSIPRNTKKLVEVFGKDFNIEDRTLVPPLSSAFKLHNGFKLKPEQQEAMDEVLINISNGDNSTILKASPGWGKSYTLPYLVNKLQTNTLIVTDRTNLVEQMKGEFETNCQELDLTILGGNIKEAKSVTLVTFQFLIRNKEFIKKHKNYFGLIVVDEAHVLGSKIFTTVVGEFNAKYRLGLTATPTRSDYMTELLYDVMGTKLVSAKSKDNLNVSMVMIDHPAKFGYTWGVYKNEYAKFLIFKNIGKDVTEICQNFKTLGRFGLIYITEAKAQEHYGEILNKSGVKAKVINQATAKEDRLKYIQMLEDETIDILISGSILQKGISIKHLDYIINLSNLTKEAHEQLVGRLRRHHPTKKAPLFLDFLFGGHSLSKSWAREELAHELKRVHQDKFSKMTFDKLLAEVKKQSAKIKK